MKPKRFTIRSDIPPLTMEDIIAKYGISQRMLREVDRDLRAIEPKRKPKAKP